MGCWRKESRRIKNIFKCHFVYFMQILKTGRTQTSQDKWRKLSFTICLLKMSSPVSFCDNRNKTFGVEFQNMLTETKNIFTVLNWSETRCCWRFILHMYTCRDDLERSQHILVLTSWPRTIRYTQRRSLNSLQMPLIQLKLRMKLFPTLSSSQMEMKHQKTFGVNGKCEICHKMLAAGGKMTS